MTYDVFISYRRKTGADDARLLQQALKVRGYNVFFDYDSLRDGKFDVRILSAIEAAKIFILVLSKESLDGCKESGDWVGREIRHAIANERKIVLVQPSDQQFEFPANLPEDISSIKYMQVSELNKAALFEESVDKLIVDRFPQNLKRRKPGWRIVWRGLPVLLGCAAIGLAIFFLRESLRMRGEPFALRGEKDSTPSSSPREKPGGGAILETNEVAGSAISVGTNAPAERIVDKRVADNEDRIVQGNHSQRQIIAEILKTMVRVEGGTFLMGANVHEDGTVEPDVQQGIETPQIKKTVGPFLIGKDEVTVGQWCMVMGCRRPNEDVKLPIRDVNFDECLEFTKRLSDISGLEFSLPRESEWEFAARGGVSSEGTRFSGGNKPDAVAWYMDTSGGVPHVCDGNMSEKDCNELDIFNMSGNVGEWCLDDFIHYSDLASTNPAPYTLDAQSKVVRGGGYDSSAEQVSVFHREPMNRFQHASNVGLRLVVRDVEKYAMWHTNFCAEGGSVRMPTMCDDMTYVYDTCVEIRSAIGAGSTIGLQSAMQKLKRIGVNYFADFRLVEGARLPLTGHLVFNEEFLRDLIDRKDVYAFAKEYGAKRTSSDGKVFLRTCVVGKSSRARYGFNSKGRQELAFVTEPGGLISVKIHDKTHGKWHRDADAFKKGRESRFFVFDLPAETSALEVEVFNRTCREISFAVISN